MAYARFGPDSDVYVFESAHSIYCQRCRSNNCRDVVAQTRSEMLAHMQKHRDAGDKVPDYAFDNLRADQVSEGDVIQA